MHLKPWLLSPCGLGGPRFSVAVVVVYHRIHMSMNMLDSKAILGTSLVHVLRLFDMALAQRCRSRALKMLVRALRETKAYCDT